MAVLNPIQDQQIQSATDSPQIDWQRVAYLTLLSRAIDDLEESELLKTRELLYQFSSRGHDMAQVILGSLVNHPGDGVCGYYRSRAFILTLGLSLEDAIAGPMMKKGGISDGRDIGVVFNMPGNDSACFLPMSGGVGTQYTPVSGWAESLVYKQRELEDESSEGAIAVALGGDASVATSGFWAALTSATTRKLPMLFYIEDNGYGISVPSVAQTPGGNIAENLASFKNLFILDGDGCDPAQAADIIQRGVGHVRSGAGPALIEAAVASPIVPSSEA